MCNCNTVTRDAITIAIWSGHPPRPPCAVCGQKKPPGEGGKQKSCMREQLGWCEWVKFCRKPTGKTIHPWRAETLSGALTWVKGCVYHWNEKNYWGGRARRSPSDRTLVSEWARKRKRTGNHIEHVRTDAAKKEPPIFGGGKTKLCLRYVTVLLAFIPVDGHRQA